MTIAVTILLTLGLALEVFAITVSGIMDNKTFKKRIWLVAIFFTIFQVLFMLGGWYLGKAISGLLGDMTQAMIFAIFAVIGIKMIWEAIKIKPEERSFPFDSFKVLLALGFASGFNTLIIGIGVNFAGISLKWILIAMGISAFVFSLFGSYVEWKYGCKYKGMGQKILGGILLIGTGIWYLVHYL
jgi:putative Mn2+ efflux pump MntP